jgi:hypothetical protein
MKLKKDFTVQEKGKLGKDGFEGEGFIASARGLKEWLSKEEIWGLVDEIIYGRSTLEEVAEKINGRDGVYIILDGATKKDHATLWIGALNNVIGGDNYIDNGGTVYFWELKRFSEEKVELEPFSLYLAVQSVRQNNTLLTENQRNSVISAIRNNMTNVGMNIGWLGNAERTLAEIKFVKGQEDHPSPPVAIWYTNREMGGIIIDVAHQVVQNAITDQSVQNAIIEQKLQAIVLHELRHVWQRVNNESNRLVTIITDETGKSTTITNVRAEADAFDTQFDFERRMEIDTVAGIYMESFDIIDIPRDPLFPQRRLNQLRNIGFSNTPTNLSDQQLWLKEFVLWYGKYSQHCNYTNSHGWGRLNRHPNEPVTEEERVIRDVLERINSNWENVNIVVEEPCSVQE